MPPPKCAEKGKIAGSKRDNPLNQRQAVALDRQIRVDLGMPA